MAHRRSQVSIVRESEANWRNRKASSKQSSRQSPELGVSPGSSLPHSLNESFFQSVHTHSLFHRPPSCSPLTLQATATGAFCNSSPYSNYCPSWVAFLVLSSVRVKLRFLALTQTYCWSPASACSLVTERLAGPSCVPCSFLHSAQILFPFHTVNFYTPLKASVNVTPPGSLSSRPS